MAFSIKNTKQSSTIRSWSASETRFLTSCKLLLFVCFGITCVLSVFYAFLVLKIGCCSPHFTTFVVLCLFVWNKISFFLMKLIWCITHVSTVNFRRLPKARVFQFFSVPARGGSGGGVGQSNDHSSSNGRPTTNASYHYTTSHHNLRQRTTSPSAGDTKSSSAVVTYPTYDDFDKLKVHLIPITLFCIKLLTLEYDH